MPPIHNPTPPGKGGICNKCGVHWAWERSLRGRCYWCEKVSLGQPVKPQTKKENTS